jgi:hypothetical protein
MKYILIIAVAAFALSCKTAEKFDYSNVQSTSLDAQIYNTSPGIIMKDTVIESHQTVPLKNQAKKHYK